MHITRETIDGMDLAHLEVARRVLGVSKAELCRQADVNPATYQRWMRFLRGDRGGTSAHGRSLRAIREALKERVPDDGGEPLSLAG